MRSIECDGNEAEEQSHGINWKMRMKGLCGCPKPSKGLRRDIYLYIIYNVNGQVADSVKLAISPSNTDQSSGAIFSQCRQAT